MRFRAGDMRVVSVSEPGLVSRNRVCVATGYGANMTAATLTLASGRVLGLAMQAVDAVPPGILMISAELEQKIKITYAAGWHIDTQDAQPVTKVTLESFNDASLQDAADAIADATDLAGQVLWRADDPDVPCWASISELPVKVRSAVGPDGRELTGLLEITGDTQVSVFGQSNRVGVDVVVLADCSGSMAIRDVLGAARGSRPPEYVRRVDALRVALRRLVESRTRLSGGLSRIAIVGFATETFPIFPVDGSMVELSDNTTADTVQRCADAVRELETRNADTDIGQALDAASNLLMQQGVPDNEKLIVLVSDGADQPPDTEEATGRSDDAITDPVALMAELNRNLDIRLQAIEIGDAAAFDRWWRTRTPDRSPETWMIPDHRLLRDLVRAGGGDRGGFLGMAALEDYFRTLGLGATVRVGTPRRVGPPALQDSVAGLARAAASVTAQDEMDIAQLAERIRRQWVFCHETSLRLAGCSIFRHPEVRQFDGLDTPAPTEMMLAAWVSGLSKVFDEGLHLGLRDQGQDYPLPGVKEIVRDGRLHEVKLIRNDLLHHWQGKAAGIQRRTSEIYQRATGAVWLSSDDEPAWLRMQIYLARQVVDVLLSLTILLRAQGARFQLGGS